MYREQKVTFHSAAGATATGTVLNCAGMSSLVVQISGTFVATVTWQASVDGTNYIAIQAENMASGAVATTATAAGLYRLSVAGLRLFRANMAWTSGTSITATGMASAAPVGLTLADIDVAAQEDVNVAQVGGEAVTADQTGRMPVSLYGKDSAAGDKEVNVSATGNLEVDVASALPAGSNAIGKLAANTGVDIGDVDVTSISAGENVIGLVGSVGTTISQTPTVTAGAYSAGDAVGGLLTFADAARVSTYGGVIKNVLLIDDAGQDAEIEIWIFDVTFTAMSDNDAWAPSEADLENLVCVVSTEDSDQGWLAAGTPSACDIEVARRYDLEGTSLFGQLVTRGTPTFAATDDVTVRIALLQD